MATSGEGEEVDAQMQHALHEADRTSVNAEPKNLLFLAAERETDLEVVPTPLSPLSLRAVRAIQRWFRRIRNAKRLQLKLTEKSGAQKPLDAHTLHTQHLSKILSLCGRREKGFEYAQSLLFSDVWLRACAALLQLSPATKQVLAEQRVSLSAAAKHVSSALLIALFPQDCLYSSLALSSEGSLSPTPAASRELQDKARQCERAAVLVRAQLQQLVAQLEIALSPSPSLSLSECMALERRCASLQRALLSFLAIFRAWKTLDTQRMTKSLEDTLSLAYATQLSAQREGDAALAQSAQQQCEKIQRALAQLLGAAEVQSRVEELRAAVEVSLSSTEPAVPALSLPPAQSTRTHTQRERSPSPHPQPQTAAGAEQAEKEKAQQRALRHLEALASVAGMENERLAHEITLDKHFRLPLHSNVASEESTTTISDTKSLAVFLKKQMLAAMADKLVNSLRRSNVDSLTQLAVDMVVPVRVASVPQTSTLSVPCYSARILRIYSLSDPAASLSLAALSSDTSFSLADVALEVEYVVERSRESDVSLDRVRLSHESNDPVPLIEALHDVCEALAALTPNRADLQQRARESFDAELLTLLLTQRAHTGESESVIDVQRELWPVLQRIFSLAVFLQAEFRVRESEQWLRCCELAFCGPTGTDSDVEAERAAQRLWEQAQCRTVSLSPPASVERELSQKRRLEDVLALVPLVLEKTMEIVEDIQRDTANYHIALLVPVLEKHGHDFLARRFKQRLQERTTSLDRTAALLAQQLQAEALAATNADLVEAEYLPSTGFSLQDLVLSGSSNDNGSADMLTRGVVARALLSLLQSPVALDSPQGAQLVPETLHWDVQRLAVLRTLADKIALESSLTLSTRQILHYFRVAPKESEETELQHRLDALLSSTSSVSASLPSDDQKDLMSRDMSSLVAEVVHYVQFAIYRTREATVRISDNNVYPTAALSNENYDLKELQSRAEKMVRDVTSAQNPILALFAKRVYKILLRALLGKPFVSKLASYSLQSKGQERNLSRLIDLATKLFQHTMKVHGDLYKALLHTLSTSFLHEQTAQPVSGDSS